MGSWALTVATVAGCLAVLSSAVGILWVVVTSRAQATRQLARQRAAMRTEVRYWQDAAARATAEAARVAREAEALAAIRAETREDVISIMPLIVAAAEQIRSQPEENSPAQSDEGSKPQDESRDRP